MVLPLSIWRDPSQRIAALRSLRSVGQSRMTCFPSEALAIWDH